MIDEDYINGLLSEEFHTTNGIPTNPETHNLFYVNRTRAVIIWLLGFFGGILAGAGFAQASSGGRHSWLWGLFISAGSLIGCVPTLFTDERRGK